jgi:hypothetical protein
MNMVPGHVQIYMETMQLAKDSVMPRRTSRHHTDTLGHKIPTVHETVPVKSLILSMHDQMTSIRDQRGTVRLDSTQLNCCQPTTLDTGYSLGTASTSGSRLSKSRPGPIAKPRSG